MTLAQRNEIRAPRHPAGRWLRPRAGLGHPLTTTN